MQQLGEEPGLRQLGWESIRMNSMVKELAVVMETDYGWMRHGLMDNCGENATHHLASL